MGFLDVGFTGTRHGMSKAQLHRLYETLRDLRNEDGDGQEFHHGCCVGADAQASKVAKSLGYVVHAHPPTSARLLDREALQLADVQHDPLSYMDRNEQIVKRTGHLVAAPLTDQEEVRSGTWATVRRARKLLRSLTLLPRDARAPERRRAEAPHG